VQEKEIQAEVLLAIGALPGVRIFRNHVGLGWSGKLVSKVGDRVTLDNARPAKFGLCTGSADLIGWISDGDIARFLSIELKRPSGRRSPEQENWERVVARSGGIAGFVTSAEEALELVKRGGANP